ncbi:MAG: hypothetical protein AAGH67_15425 [Cyanobacteria bacterium P01_H01_bin.162]
MPQPISGFNTVTAQQRDRSGLCELSHALSPGNFIARIDVIFLVTILSTAEKVPEFA